MIYIIIFWILLGGLQLIAYCKAISALEKWKDKVLVSFLFMLGGPFFSITMILEYIITLILGEDWNDDDDNFPLGGN